jgi:hypothetical protein
MWAASPDRPPTRRACPLLRLASHPPCQCFANYLSYLCTRIYPPDALWPQSSAFAVVPEFLEQALMTVPGDDVWTSALDRVAAFLRPGFEAWTTASSFTPPGASGELTDGVSAWSVANCEAHHIVSWCRVQCIHVQPWATTVQRSLTELPFAFSFTFSSLLHRRWRQVRWRARF